ncbi:carcinoembryonic antigen-related cell adhesion molecule 20-like [Limanda limanda]|uniref:carcinoembryonic antigen-related cell adhesion molecule 20-like n=1 Tax=Limanda limanda TaxID=27771 RepID=UPI0029C777DF|nr:carcinoembryonic antigen-related cell adhesion molecule 20-like [Limanda limanda]
MHVSAGLCHGAGFVTVDVLHGITGGSVTFTTSVKPSAETFLALTWGFNGTTNVITSTTAEVVGQGYENRVEVDKSTGSLVLRHLTEKDSGEYELMIIPNGGEQIQGTAKLEVLNGPDRPIIDQTPIEAEMEERVTLRCSADSLPRATYYWRFKHMLIYGPVHFIHEMEERHLGKYTCTAQNSVTGLETSEVHKLHGT